MKRKKKLVNKEYKKRFVGKCKFCPCDTYELLDLHRIQEGCEGGKYTDRNTVVCCASCHRKIHSGMIKIDKHYETSLGKIILHFWINDIEYWQ